MVELLFKIPGDLRFKNRRTKYLQRTAMADRLPEITLTRRKMGFTPPLYHWLLRDNSQWAHDLLDNGAAVESARPRADRVSNRHLGMPDSSAGFSWFVVNAVHGV
jgi:hypothetical protein